MCNDGAYIRTLYRRPAPEDSEFRIGGSVRLTQAGNEPHAATMGKLADYTFAGPLSLYLSWHTDCY